MDVRVYKCHVCFLIVYVWHIVFQHKRYKHMYMNLRVQGRDSSSKVEWEAFLLFYRPYADVRFIPLIIVDVM